VSTETTQDCKEKPVNPDYVRILYASIKICLQHVSAEIGHDQAIRTEKIPKVIKALINLSVLFICIN
jgi:hypothetical protein